MGSFTASLELCKELVALSGWGNDGLLAEHWSEDGETPLYDLGYLLRKLPHGTYLRKNIQEPKKLGGNYKGKYTTSLNNRDVLRNYNEYADTPEDATCKLAIELFKQGILSKEDGNELSR